MYVQQTRNIDAFSQKSHASRAMQGQWYSKMSPEQGLSHREERNVQGRHEQGQEVEILLTGFFSTSWEKLKNMSFDFSLTGDVQEYDIA
jgi:reverse gyrase